jgi:hypothetical protein
MEQPEISAIRKPSILFHVVNASENQGGYEPITGEDVMKKNKLYCTEK